ncbi:MAG: tetratricopeptide repeat protein [Leptospiraceae bacterium]
MKRATLILFGTLWLCAPLGAEDPNTSPAEPGSENPDNPQNNPGNNPGENVNEPTSGGPSSPADFRNYKTNREKRNESFKVLYNQEADRRFRFILEQISEGQYDSARRRLQDFLILYPSHPMAGRARMELADLQRKTGDHRAALKRYQQSAILETPDQKEPRSMLEMARIHIQQGQYSKARSLLQNIQNRFPGTAEQREAQLLERSFRFIESPRTDENPSNPGTNQDNLSGQENQDSGKPLFPMDNSTEKSQESEADDTGIDTADGRPSTGQRALDRMGEGIEKADSGSSVEPSEPSEPSEPGNGEPKKSP